MTALEAFDGPVKLGQSAGAKNKPSPHGVPQGLWSAYGAGIARKRAKPLDNKTGFFSLYFFLQKRRIVFNFYEKNPVLFPSGNVFRRAQGRTGKIWNPDTLTYSDDNSVIYCHLPSFTVL